MCPLLALLLPLQLYPLVSVTEQLRDPTERDGATEAESDASLDLRDFFVGEHVEDWAKGANVKDEIPSCLVFPCRAGPTLDP